MEAIQVVTEVQRRRFSVEQKIRCLQESNLLGMTVSYIARKYGISPSLLFHWRNRMVEGGKKAVAVDVLKEAYQKYGYPSIVNLDQGSQFTAEAFVCRVTSACSKRFAPHQTESMNWVRFIARLLCFGGN